MSTYTPIPGTFSAYSGPRCHTCGGTTYFVSVGPDDADVECITCLDLDERNEDQRADLEERGAYDDIAPPT